PIYFIIFFFHGPAATHIYTLSLHDALPIFEVGLLELAAHDLLPRGGELFLHGRSSPARVAALLRRRATASRWPTMQKQLPASWKDRKSTRLNSSHVANSYAVFRLKKKKKQQ